MSINKKTIIHIFCYIFFVLLLAINLVHHALGLNINHIFTSNYIKYPIVFIFLISIFYVLPLIKPKSVLNSFLISLWVICHFIQLSFFAAAVNMPIYELVTKLSHEYYILYTIFVYASLLAAILSILIYLTNKNLKSKVKNIHGLFLIFYSLLFVIWIYKILYDPIFFFSVLDQRPYDILHQFFLIFSGAYLFFSTIYLLSHHFHKHLFLDPPKQELKHSKSFLLFIWFILGFLGIERIYLRSKMTLMNFQFITTIVLLTHLFIISNYYYHYKFNILYTIFIFLVVITKLFAYFKSFNEIISINQRE